MRRNLSQNGLLELMGHEGLKLLAYDDFRPKYELQPGDSVIGTLTIGYGHTGPDVFIGQTITKTEAMRLLRKDVEWAEEAVNDLITTGINQNQFDALVSFTYNVGRSKFAGSTLRKKVNARRFEEAALEFKKWRLSKGKVLKGLVKRRSAESALFMTPVAAQAQPDPVGPVTDISPAPDTTEHTSVNQSGSVNATRIGAGVGGAGSAALAASESVESDQIGEVASQATDALIWVDMIQTYGPWVLLGVVVGTWVYVEWRRRKQIKEANS